MTLRTPFVGIIFLIVIVFETQAQCCAAGNPATTGIYSGFCIEKSLGISVFYQHSYSDIYYEGTKKSDFKYIDNSYYNFSSILLNYGLTDNINVFGDIGFFFDKTQNFDFGNDSKFNRKAKGIGDASLGVQYYMDLAQNNSLSFIPGFKITLPVGEFDQKNGAVILPIDIQPSSGNFKYEFGITIVKHINEHFTILSVNNYEILQRIETERTNYKYGNLANISLIGIFNVFKDLSAICQVRAQFREKSSDRDRNLINSTGGFVLFFTPQILFNISNDLSVNIQTELPVYKEMNGIQLTNNYAFGLRISKTLNLNQKFRSLSVDISDENSLSFTEIKVNGVCEMCKERIEKITSEFENVITADWNLETKILKIGYVQQPDFDAIKKDIAKAGHDNETFTANDEDYNRLHKCCKYR